MENESEAFRAFERENVKRESEKNQREKKLSLSYFQPFLTLSHKNENLIKFLFAKKKTCISLGRYKNDKQRKCIVDKWTKWKFLVSKSLFKSLYYLETNCTFSLSSNTPQSLILTPCYPFFREVFWERYNKKKTLRL